MVDKGPLTRNQFEALRGVLVAGGYLLQPKKRNSPYRLTDKGTALLEEYTE